MGEGMSHQEGFFTGVRGADIYYQHWLPEGRAESCAANRPRVS
jgi:alpha-beta hydrolase superfamily lysophospholipase